MDHRPNAAFLTDITGALDWWRDAGVDCDFLDEPVAWLTPQVPEGENQAPPERRPRPVIVEAEAAPSPARLNTAELPTELSAFKSWWLTEPLLGEGDTSGRIAPAGNAGAELMVIVEEPELEDGDSLLSGPQGRLLDAILTAFGTRRDQIYLASALPRHTPGADWAALQRRGLGQVLAHHVRLAGPQRVLTFGGNVLSLIGHELPQRPAVLRSFHHEGGTIPLLASWALPALIGQPRAKPVLWKAWLEWTAV